MFSRCKRVPKGRVTTYKEIGNALGGYGQVYRAVGVALNRNPHAPVVPCHRVVNSDSRVGGFAHGTAKKIEMLRAEGVEIKDGKVVDFERRLYCFRK
jgi:methylated-DNA-[protein]-cysteine S-methyltransferase